MSYLFENFGLFIYNNKEKCQDICKLFNVFARRLNPSEKEFAYNEFPLFILVGKSLLSASPDIWPYIIGKK